MKFFFNLLIKHVTAAVLENWGWTVAGVIAALLQAGPELAKFFQGTDIQHVNWAAFGNAAFSLAIGALGKNAFSWKAFFTGLKDSAPRAQLVKKP